MRRSASHVFSIGVAWILATLVHLVLSLATWLSQDTVVFEAPIQLPLHWPWPIVAFPVLSMTIAVLNLQTATWLQLVWLHALNSVVWGACWCLIREKVNEWRSR